METDRVSYTTVQTQSGLLSTPSACFTIVTWESQQTPELEEDRTPWCRTGQCWTLVTIWKQQQQKKTLFIVCIIPFWVKRKHSVPNAFPLYFLLLSFWVSGMSYDGPYHLKGVHFPLSGKRSVHVFCTEIQKHRGCHSPSRRQWDVINCLSILTISTYPCRHLITMTN